MRHIPGVTTSKVAKEGHAALMEMVERPFGNVKSSLENGSNEDPHSFVASSLLANADDDDHIQVSTLKGYHVNQGANHILVGGCFFVCWWRGYDSLGC